MTHSIASNELLQSDQPDVSVNGVSAPPSDHREHIRALMNVGAPCTCTPVAGADVSLGVLMATYNSPERARTIVHALESIRQQHLPLRVFLADNGMNDAMREQVLAEAAQRGLSLQYIPAYPRPGVDADRSPAYSRNTAIQWMVDRFADHPEERLHALYLHDDDSALQRESLPVLVRALNTRSKLAAVMPRVQLVPSLVPEQYGSAPTGDQRLHTLPSAWNDGEIDWPMLVSLSSDATVRTSAALIRWNALARIAETVAPFVSMPRKSAEDLLFGSALSRMGDVARVEGVASFDQLRPSAVDGRRQRAQWGEDHVYVANDLRDLGVLRPRGMHVLYPGESGWQMTVDPAQPQMYIINPRQLSQVLESLIAQLSGDPDAQQAFIASCGAEGRISPDDLALAIGEAMERIGFACALQNAAENAEVPSERHPVMQPAIELSPDHPRNRADFRTGQLFGNIVGNTLAQTISPRPVFFYGLRQFTAQFPSQPL